MGEIFGQFSTLLQTGRVGAVCFPISQERLGAIYCTKLMLLENDNIRIHVVHSTALQSLLGVRSWLLLLYATMDNASEARTKQTQDTMSPFILPGNRHDFKMEYNILHFVCTDTPSISYPSLPAISETWLIVRHSTLARLGRCHVDYFLFFWTTCD